MSNFSMARGTTLAITHDVYQNGLPVTTLAGGHMIFTLKKNATDADSAAVAQFDNQSLGQSQGGITFDPVVLYRSKITMLPGPTLALPAVGLTVLFFEIMFKDASGNTWQTDSGLVEVTQRTSTTQP